MDLNGRVAVRARAAGEGPATELVLARSTYVGPPVRLQTNRELLARAIRLGFAEVEVVDADTPLVCRDDRVVFAAVFNYAPNADGAVWFARHVWPRVRAVRPNARLTLAGSSPTRAVRQLADRDGSIEVTGSVADIRPYLWRSAIAVAPIFQARGVQNKVLEAAAAGLPSVVTPPVWEGLPREVLKACRVADSPDQFAARVLELLALPPAVRRREASAQLSQLAWPRRLARMMELIESTAERSSAIACAR